MYGVDFTTIAVRKWCRHFYLALLSGTLKIHPYKPPLKSTLVVLNHCSNKQNVGVIVDFVLNSDPCRSLTPIRRLFSSSVDWTVQRGPGAGTVLDTGTISELADVTVK